MKDIVNGMPVGVEKVKCEESDDDVDEIGEDDDDCLEPQKRTTPAKGKDKARSKMPGMTGMTAAVPAVLQTSREPGFVPEHGEGCNNRQTKAQGGE